MFLGPICLVLGKHMENAKHIFQRSSSDFVVFDASDKHWLFKMVSDNCRRNVLPSYICCWKFYHPIETIAKNNTTLFYSNVQILFLFQTLPNYDFDLSVHSVKRILGTFFLDIVSTLFINWHIMQFSVITFLAMVEVFVDRSGRCFSFIT